ncbi:MAG: tetratricopeptide repeat protein [Nitrospinota bacterium]
MTRPKPVTTYIGPGVRLSGELRFRGTCLVHGTVGGRIESEGVLEVGPSGLVRADVDVGELHCRGRLEGTITARTRLALLAGSMVEGAVNTPWLEIQEGATLCGLVAMERQTGFVPPRSLATSHRARIAGGLVPVAAAVALLLLAGGWALSRSRPTIGSPTSTSLLVAAEEAVKRKDYGSAWRFYETAFRAQPRDERVVLGLANVAFVLGRRPDAIAYYERALELSPNHAAVHHRLGELYAMEGRRKEALSHYQRVLEKNPHEGRVLLAAAELNEQLGDAAQALALYERLRTLKPHQAEVPVRMAALYARQGRFHKAIETYRALAAKHPEDLELKLALARVMLEAGEGEPAADLFAEIASKDPQRLEAVRTAADLYLRLGKRKKAMGLLERAVAALPQNVPLRLTLAELYRLQLQPTKALHHWQKVLGRDPTNRQAALGVAERRAAQGRPTEALAVLEAVAAAHPEDAEVHYQMGHLFYKQKMWERAVDALQKALQLDPNHAEALNRLAWLYATREGNLDEAVRLSERSLAMNPESPVFLDTLAEIRFRRREYREALRLIRRAVEKAPQSPYYRRQMAKFERAAQRHRSGS